jgi:hypothetical protein
VLRARAAAGRAVAAARALPGAARTLRAKVADRAPTLLAQAREEWVEARPLLVEKARAFVASKLPFAARPST